MTPTLEMSTPLEIPALQGHFHVQHGPKDTPVFLPGDGEASSLLLWSLVSLISGCTVQPESTYSCFLKVTGQVLDKHQHYSWLQLQSVFISLSQSQLV